MSLLYVVKAKKNPQNPLAGVKYYLQAKIRGHRKHKDVLKSAAKNTTLSEKEVDMAVSAWFGEVITSLEDGFSVEVADLGTFSLSIKSEGSDTEAEATAAKKSAINLLYRAKPVIREQVNHISLEKYIPGGTL
jgi:predicted histone-like DNA-binding protein